MRFRYSWRKIVVLIENSGDPDQMLCSAVSDRVCTVLSVRGLQTTMG